MATLPDSFSGPADETTGMPPSTPVDLRIGRSRRVVLGVLGASLLAGGVLPAVAGATSPSGGSCPIDVGAYGHDLGAAQAALKAVSTTCRTVVFTPGTYVFNGSLKVRTASVTLTAEPGAVIVAAAGASLPEGFVSVNASSVSLTNLTIDGTGNTGSGILVKAPNGKVTGTTVRNVGGRPIYMLASGTDATITDCTVSDFRGNRGITTQAARTTITGCTVTGGRGISIWSFSGADGTAVINNTVDGAGDKGIEMSSSTHFTVSGNIVHDSHTIGIHLLRSNTGTVSNNTVYHNRNNGIDAHGDTFLTISGNRSYLNGGPRLPETLEGQGIIVYCSQNIKVLSNTVWNNAQGQPGKRDGIHLSDTQGRGGEMVTRYIMVDGNVSYDDQPVPTQGWAIHIGGSGAGRVGGDLDFITVTNNTGYGNVNAGLFTKGLAPGATTTIFNNTLTAR